MLGKFRKKKAMIEDVSSDITQDMELQPKAVIDAVSRASAEKPFVAQQVTGREISQNILDALKDDRGVHVDTAFGVLGSLAGFACHYAIFDQIRSNGLQPAPNTYVHQKTPEGHRRYFGTLIHNNLFASEMSIWSLASAMAIKLGAENLPDMGELIAYSETLAESDNDIWPRLPETHMPRDMPLNFVRHLFPSYLPLLNKYDPDTSKYCLSFGFAIQTLMDTAKDVVDPETALHIVMECAAPAAQIDPAEVI